MTIQTDYSASKIFRDWLIPERVIIKLQLGCFYQKNPVMARVLITPVAFITGTIKVFLFPVICLVGVIAMPIIALIKAHKGEKNAGEWLKAWSFSIIGLAASIAFFGVTCYYLPLIVTCAMIVTLIVISIVCHVHGLLHVHNYLEQAPVSKSPLFAK